MSDGTTRDHEGWRLQDCLNDLAKILGLHAVSARGSREMLEISLDALLGMLRLEFAYARLSEGLEAPPIEIIRTKAHCPAITGEAIGQALGFWLKKGKRSFFTSIPNPLAAGAAHIAAVRLGLQEEIATIVVGSTRATFPTCEEMLCLEAAVGQAVIALQESARAVERRDCAHDLHEHTQRGEAELAALNTALTREIAEHKQADAALRRMEGLLKQRRLAEAVLTAAKDEAEYRARDAEEARSILNTLFENANEGITLTGGPPDFRIIANSKYAARLIGRDARSLLDISAGFHAGVYGLLRASDGKRPRPEELPLYRATRNGEIVENEEWIIQRPDGTRIPILTNVAPVRDYQGKVIGAVNCWRDITERKRSEEALRASEQRFRHYFDLGLVGMAVTSPTKGCLEVNSELCRILGYARSELMEMNWLDMAHPDDRAGDIAQFNRVLSGETDGYTLDKRWIRKDGRVIDSIMSAKCHRHADGSVDYIIWLVLDTTERKQAEADLQKAHVELTHVARLSTMGELAASLAHELNQPLGAIVNNSNVCMRILDQQRPAGELREALTDIVSDAKRASTIVARVRALTKRSVQEHAPLFLPDVAADVLALARRELTERRITVRTEFEADLPRLSGDRVQLQQVLLNLVMNGIEAMTAVKDDRRVLTLGACRDALNGEPAVRMTVKDLGSGLQPHNDGRLFEAFYTTKPHGMGMGLRISRSIIEAHGGRIWAAPNEGPGTSFHCVLPVGNNLNHA